MSLFQAASPRHGAHQSCLQFGYHFLHTKHLFLKKKRKKSNVGLSGKKKNKVLLSLFFFFFSFYFLHNCVVLCHLFQFSNPTTKLGNNTQKTFTFLVLAKENMQLLLKQKNPHLETFTSFYTLLPLLFNILFIHFVYLLISSPCQCSGRCSMIRIVYLQSAEYIY